MNLTSLIAHAFATQQALETGWTWDPLLIDLTDEIYRISGADPCAFGVCGTGFRNLFFDPDIVDYITSGVPEQYSTDYEEFYGGGRLFVLQFNDSLPFVKTVVAACARATLPTILGEVGDEALCTLGKTELTVPNETVEELVVYYHRALAYNACLFNETQIYEYKPRMCLMSAFGLNEPPLYNAARAAQTVRQMLVRRLRFLTADIVEERNRANDYLYEAGKSDEGSSGFN